MAIIKPTTSAIIHMSPAQTGAVNTPAPPLGSKTEGSEPGAHPAMTRLVLLLAVLRLLLAASASSTWPEVMGEGA